MLKDQYDNSLSTTSPAACDHYVTGIDRILGGMAGMVESFASSLDADPGFALAHVGMARAQQISANVAAAHAAMAKARELAKGLSDRETSHINAMGMLIDGKKTGHSRNPRPC